MALIAAQLAVAGASTGRTQTAGLCARRASELTEKSLLGPDAGLRSRLWLQSAACALGGEGAPSPGFQAPVMVISGQPLSPLPCQTGKGFCGESKMDHRNSRREAVPMSASVPRHGTNVYDASQW